MMGTQERNNRSLPRWPAVLQASYGPVGPPPSTQRTPLPTNVRGSPPDTETPCHWMTGKGHVTTRGIPPGKHSRFPPSLRCPPTPTRARPNHGSPARGIPAQQSAWPSNPVLPSWDRECPPPPHPEKPCCPRAPTRGIRLQGFGPEWSPSSTGRRHPASQGSQHWKRCLPRRHRNPLPHRES